MRSKNLAKPPEAWISHQVRADVVQRARNVLDVHGVVLRRGLEAERAQGLDVALYGHQIETPAELLWIGRRIPRAAEGEEEGDELLHLLLGEVDVGISQQR